MTNWPDPERPGVPLNPDVSGWHWLQNRKPNCAPYPVWWSAGKGWAWNAVAYFPTPDTEFRYHYLGPCLTPAEVAAREAAARREGIEAAAALCDAISVAILDGSHKPNSVPRCILTSQDCAAAISALLPAPR